MAEHAPPAPPPPISPWGVRVSGERNSRFIETPMDEYTPANSIYDDNMVDHVDRTGTRMFLRVVNAVVHLLVCVLLLAIMATFLSQSHGLYIKSMTPQAITVLIILSFDIVLDLATLIQPRQPHSGWSLLLRLIFGIGYLAVFMVYIGLGRVFPGGYSYWGLPSGYAWPIVYLFLWLIGVWNLLNTALHRHHFGQDIRTYTQTVSSWRHARRRDQQGSRRSGLGHAWGGRRRRGNRTADVERIPVADAVQLPSRNSVQKAGSTTPTTTSASTMSESAAAEVTRPPTAAREIPL